MSARTTNQSMLSLQLCFSANLISPLRTLILTVGLTVSRLNHNTYSLAYFDLVTDRILFYSLRQVSLVDEQLNKTENPQQKTQEASIDVRRASGRLTNLKLAEFSPISQLRYGGRLCEPQTYGANLSLIVLVITKPDDFYIRSLIRKTWGQKFQSNSTRLYFCFGLPAKANFHKRDIYYSKEMVEQLLEREEEQFADIIQWMFEDGYYRLTIKSLAIVRWVSVYCPRVASVFKVDADVLVNYENLLRFTSQVNAARPKVLQQLPVRVASSEVNFTIHGNVWQHAKVARSHRSKFYTSFKDYPSGEYPSYAGGPWLLGRESHSLLVYMMAVHKNMPALLWEDLYVTGLVRKSLLSAGVPVQLLPLKGFHYAPAEKNINWCLFNQSVIVTQSLSEKNLPDIWKEIQNPPKHSNCTLLSH